MDDTATPEFDAGYETGTRYGFVNGKTAIGFVFSHTQPPTPPSTTHTSISTTNRATVNNPHPPRLCRVLRPPPAPTVDPPSLCVSATLKVEVFGIGTTASKHIRVGDKILTGTSHTGGHNSFELSVSFGIGTFLPCQQRNHEETNMESSAPPQKTYTIGLIFLDDESDAFPSKNF